MVYVQDINDKALTIKGVKDEYVSEHTAIIVFYKLDKKQEHMVSHTLYADTYSYAPKDYGGRENALSFIFGYIQDKLLSSEYDVGKGSDKLVQGVYFNAKCPVKMDVIQLPITIQEKIVYVKKTEDNILETVYSPFELDEEDGIIFATEGTDELDGLTGS